MSIVHVGERRQKKERQTSDNTKTININLKIDATIRVVNQPAPRPQKLPNNGKIKFIFTEESGVKNGYTIRCANEFSADVSAVHLMVDDGIDQQDLVFSPDQPLEIVVAQDSHCVVRLWTSSNNPLKLDSPVSTGEHDCTERNPPEATPLPDNGAIDFAFRGEIA